MSHQRVNPPSSDAPGRPYRSAKRAQGASQTRQTIREAATTLFLKDGYTRTSMKAIASRAGVSEKTMYLAYSTKANLLSHVIQVAVRGDEDPAPLSRRPEWQAVLHGPPKQAFTRFATLNAAVMARTAAIIAVGEAAAAGDPELAAYRDQAHENARADVRALVTALTRAGALAHDIDERAAADTIYALAADESIYLRLTHECGWTDTQYAELIATILQATLSAHKSPSNRRSQKQTRST
jgi:AcrR family transcriptional regulator